MSNDNEIYPLEREWMDEAQNIHTRTVNQRLAPIFRALADDPDGWDYIEGGGKVSFGFATCDLPCNHEGCDLFRLVRKRKTITVEIPVYGDGDIAIKTYPDGSAMLHIPYDKHANAAEARDAIDKAMEEQE